MVGPFPIVFGETPCNIQQKSSLLSFLPSRFLNGSAGKKIHSTPRHFHRSFGNRIPEDRTTQVHLPLFSFFVDAKRHPDRLEK